MIISSNSLKNSILVQCIIYFFIISTTGCEQLSSYSSSGTQLNAGTTDDDGDGDSDDTTSSDYTTDTDGDGCYDWWEDQNGYDKDDGDDCPEDSDEDGGDDDDTDDDGWTDELEEAYGTDPNDPDDYPVAEPYVAENDEDGDCQSDELEELLGTDPEIAADYTEGVGCDALDTDDDGYCDLVEETAGSDPADPDSVPELAKDTDDFDDDCYSDWLEQILQTDPMDDDSTPIEMGINGDICDTTVEVTEARYDMSHFCNSAYAHIETSFCDGKEDNWEELYACVEPSGSSSTMRGCDSDGAGYLAIELLGDRFGSNDGGTIQFFEDSTFERWSSNGGLTTGEYWFDSRSGHLMLRPLDISEDYEDEDFGCVEIYAFDYVYGCAPHETAWNKYDSVLEEPQSGFIHTIKMKGFIPTTGQSIDATYTRDIMQCDAKSGFLAGMGWLTKALLIAAVVAVVLALLIVTEIFTFGGATAIWVLLAIATVAYIAAVAANDWSSYDDFDGTCYEYIFDTMGSAGNSGSSQ